MPPSLWSPVRRPRERRPSAEGQLAPLVAAGTRSRFQHDYDRLLFSTPVRRLADKTQVWPMDQNDGVRTRLTHSHEVANLARSIGTRVLRGAPEAFAGADLHETVQPILSAIGLAHDLGNPPFGHQGEAAIGRWFSTRRDWIFRGTTECGAACEMAVPRELWPEFEEFDGNPQSLRLVARLQTHQHHVGLDLTAATLAALLKYPVSYAGRRSGRADLKKGGYFASERELVEWFRTETGLAEGQRHPLTWIMEACDDVAYSVLDVDDLLRKAIISPDDVLVAIRHAPDAGSEQVVGDLEKTFRTVNEAGRGVAIGRDIKTGYLRAIAMTALIEHAAKVFVGDVEAIFAFRRSEPLMDGSPLCKVLKGIASQHGFAHPSALRAEAAGARAIDALMSSFWHAITTRSDPARIDSKRTDPAARYVFSLISPNYLEAACGVGGAGAGESLRYRELRLLTDMVSGMTDSFATRLWKDLGSLADAGGA